MPRAAALLGMARSTMAPGAAAASVARVTSMATQISAWSGRQLSARRQDSVSAGGVATSTMPAPSITD